VTSRKQNGTGETVRKYGFYGRYVLKKPYLGMALYFPGWGILVVNIDSEVARLPRRRQ